MARQAGVAQDALHRIATPHTMPPLLSTTDLHPFNRFDVPSLLAHRAAHRRDHPFIVWEPFEGDGQTWTYGQFHAQVGRIAGGLARRGVGARDRVLIHLDNCPETLLAWYACAWLGARAPATASPLPRRLLQPGQPPASQSAAFAPEITTGDKP